MTICAVKLCHNTSEKQHKSSGVTFHRFPSDPIQVSRWINQIRLCRKEEWWKPTKHTKICSNHFEEKFFYTTKGGQRRLHQEAVPTKDLHICCSNQDTINHDETPFMERQLKPSTSQENDNDEEIPSIQEELQASTSQLSPIEDDTDMESTSDTPGEAYLRKQLRKKTLLSIKHSNIIKFLRRQNYLLKERNKSLKIVLSELKKEHREQPLGNADRSEN